MWLVGAGASSAAGVPTADDMTWDFKRRLFCSEQGVPRTAVADIGNDAVRNRIQAYFDEAGSYPLIGSEDEYAAYFEAAFAADIDRQQYLDSMLRDRRPSHGHRALALLLKLGKARVVWTTNFDRLIEDAATEVFGGTGDLVVGSLSEAKVANRAINAGERPVLMKLHGDFQSIRLRNTQKEVRQLDVAMRRVLIGKCRCQGLAVVGYSGRDGSIMEALEDGLDEGRGYPGGLFWFSRAGSAHYPRVLKLIENAVSMGIDANLIEVETFDELMNAIARFLPDTASVICDYLRPAPPVSSRAPLRGASSRPPILRVNALPIVSAPTMCRLIKCDIGGWSEVQNAIAEAETEVIAGRIRNGVVGFGTDDELRTTFEPYDMESLDTYPIHIERLERPTGERSLLWAALCRALERHTQLTFERRGVHLYALAGDRDDMIALCNARMENAMQGLRGVVAGSGVGWAEACELHLDFRLGRLWLVLVPTVLLYRPDDCTDETLRLAKDFRRERTARRYNRQADSIMSGWAVALLGGDRGTMEVRALGVSNGLDAVFEISRVTGFSGKA